MVIYCIGNHFTRCWPDRFIVVCKYVEENKHEKGIAFPSYNHENDV